MTIFSVGKAYRDERTRAFFCKINCPAHPNAALVRVATDREAEARAHTDLELLVRVRQAQAMHRHEALHKAERRRWRKSRRPR